MTMAMGAAAAAASRRDADARLYGVDARLVWWAAGTLCWMFAAGGRWDLPLAPWLFSAFLLRSSRTSRPRTAVAMSAAASVAAAFFWALEGAVPMNAVVALSVFAYGLIFALPLVADRLAAPRLSPVAGLFVFPLAHTACEFGLGLFSPQGASYGLLAVTQSDALPLLQLVGVTGPFGLGFVICLLATVANGLWERPLAPGARRAAGLYGAGLAVVLVAGGARLAFAPPRPETVRIAGISPSAEVVAAAARALGRPVTAAGDPRTADPVQDAAALAPITAELFAQTHAAAQAGAQVVVWSENAAALAPGGEAALLAQASSAAQREHIYLDIADNLPAVHDEALLFGPDGRRIWTYEKAHPIPGLEVYAPGPQRAQTVRTPLGRLGQVICYDADFPGMMHVPVDVMLVPGGDWPEFGAVHTLKMARLRAVENGYGLFRQDFNGLSAAFDHQGRVLGLQDTTTLGPHLFLADVPRRGAVTLYRMTGDVFAWLSVVALAALVGWAVLRPRPAASL